MKSKQELIDKWESAIEVEAAEFYGKGKEERLISYMKDFVSDLNQLDEPETLTPEWIDERIHYSTDQDAFGNIVRIEMVPAKYLQNLLVPKQELPVIPKFVAEFLIGKEDYMLYELFDDEWLYKEHDRVAKWLYDNDELTNKQREIDLVMARDRGGMVEEEQKYYVLDTEDIPMLVKSYGAVNRANTHLSIHEKGRNTEHYQLTEQEIKDYDPRYMTFAKPVKELEECL